MNGTLSAMLNEFAVRFWKVSEESLGRVETQHQTCHKLFFHKCLLHLLYKCWIPSRTRYQCLSFLATELVIKMLRFTVIKKSSVLCVIYIHQWPSCSHWLVCVHDSVGNLGFGEGNTYFAGSPPPGGKPLMSSLDKQCMV